MMTPERSERLMQAAADAYVEDLRNSMPDARDDVISAMRLMYVAGWRDCDRAHRWEVAA